VSWTQGQVIAGAFSIGLGDLPAEYDDPTNRGGYIGPYEGWDNIINPTQTYTELYTRQYLRFGAGWSGINRKFHRLRILSDYKPGDTVHPTAYQGQFWQQINANQGGTIGALYFNSTNGVVAGEVVDTGKNSGAAKWDTQVRGSEVIWQDYPAGSDWICVEAHVKLNTDDGSADGIEEFWVGGVLDARNTNQNMRGTYNQYGINQIVFDNYWNDGSPQYNELYRDNFVISTERIGCLPDSVVLGGAGDGSVGKPGTPHVVGQ
jgi:hypothetical protein